jgi:hypothetical protein
MMPFARLIAIMLCASGVCALLNFGAAARPLDKTSCTHLKTEHQELLTPEMRKALDHGADWVKGHLDSSDLDKVREFLVVEEDLEFRCPGGGVDLPKPPPLPDHKPPVPPPETADVEPAPENQVSSDLLPDRNPSRASSSPTDAGSSQPVAESDKTAPAQVGTSQTVADSDKTQRLKSKATR